LVSDSTATDALLCWENRTKLLGRSGERLRVMVDITEAIVPAAFVPYAKAPPIPVSGEGRQAKSKRCTVRQAAPTAARRGRGATNGRPTS
ncbi:unnamed protein product, partial [Laminaria digitata]